MKLVGVKYYIEQYLAKHGKQPGGNLERDIAVYTTYKPGTIGRALRHMENKGILVKSYRRIGTSPEFVLYELARPKEQLTF